VRCEDCGCRHLIPVQKQQHPIQFRGQKITVTKQVMRCRHCGRMCTATEKDSSKPGDLET
jgi:hypothetical protein